MHKLSADDGDAAGNRRSDAQAPVSILIEAQHLPGKRHAKSHEQKKDAEYPGEFAGEFVCAE